MCCVTAMCSGHPPTGKSSRSVGCSGCVTAAVVGQRQRFVLVESLIGVASVPLPGNTAFEGSTLNLIFNPLKFLNSQLHSGGYLNLTLQHSMPAPPSGHGHARRSSVRVLVVASPPVSLFNINSGPAPPVVCCVHEGVKGHQGGDL